MASADVLDNGESELDRIVNDVEKKLLSWLDLPVVRQNPEVGEAIAPLVKTIGELPAIRASAQAAGMKAAVTAVASEAKSELQQELRRLKRERALGNPSQRAILTETEKEKSRAFADRLR
jgi:hypothetical protein